MTAWSDGNRSVGNTIPSSNRISPVLSFTHPRAHVKSLHVKTMKSFGFLSPLLA